MDESPLTNDPASEPPSQQKLEELCRQFESAWRGGAQPRIEDYLDTTPEPERSELLRRLLALDLALSSQSGSHPSPETYHSRFPGYRALIDDVFRQVRGPAEPSVAASTDKEGAREITRPGLSLTGPYQEGSTADALIRRPVEGRLRLAGFEILGLLGRGGMGVVYRARQRSLDRDVALKCLPPALAGDPERLERFRNEARLAGSLKGAGVVPVFDVLDGDDGPVLVMQHIDGADLGSILADRQAVAEGAPAAGRHPWAVLSDVAYLKQILPVLDRLVDALTVLDQNQVIHRDIKPSNVLVERTGHVWLTDFGLARLAGEALLTLPGQRLGTSGFMSPEQWDGRADIDSRADLFSVGATLYKALTLQLPYGRGRVAADSPLPSAPSRVQRILSKDFDTVLLKALAPDRADRYQSARDFQEDWHRIRQGHLPRHARPVGRLRRLARQVRRHPWATASMLLLSLLGAALVYALSPLAHDTTVYRTVRLTTEPAGARVVLVPISADSGEVLAGRAIRPAGKTPLTLRRVPAGQYLVVAEVPGHGFHEVCRTVPTSGQLTGPQEDWHLTWQEDESGLVTLPTIEIPGKDITRGMAFFQGGEFTMGSADLKIRGSLESLVPAHQRQVAPFYLDVTEVTVAAYRKVKGSAPTHRGPAPLTDVDAVSGVPFDSAVMYAEKVGKRLPDEAEYELAATDGGKRKYPWGDTPPPQAWIYAPAGLPPWDRSGTDPPVYGLYSGVAEWTMSWLYPYPNSPPEFHQNYNDPRFAAIHRSARVVRGGPPSVVEGRPDPEEVSWGPRFRHGYSRDAMKPGLGFRCARSARPRFLNDE
jgi:serine/threonine protein kinase/formylglycine-generating enzyme required for sulfatase activity